MKSKPLVPRERALQDIGEAVDYYAADAGAEIAERFVEALESVLRAIASQPAAGSPRYAHELGMRGLRCRRLGRFPYLVFYIERGDHIDIWRVIHAHRDIPAWMRDPDGLI